MQNQNIVLLPVAAEKLANEFCLGLVNAGIKFEVGTETVCGLELLKVTFGARPGAGASARMVKLLGRP